MGWEASGKVEGRRLGGFESVRPAATKGPRCVRACMRVCVCDGIKIAVRTMFYRRQAAGGGRL
eukprot:358439-Chlamydomonas_euryale.AAC.7